MLIRLCLCALIVLASATVAARDAKLSSAGGGSCPDTLAEKKPLPAPRGTSAVREPAKPRPILHSDAQPRVSPRWNSFVPGMFR